MTGRAETAAPARCELVAENTDSSIVVDAVGFHLHVEGAARFAFVEGASAVEVSVDAPLRFTGRADPTDVQLYLSGAHDEPGIRVESGVVARDVAAVPGGAEVTLAVDHLVALRTTVTCGELAIGPSPLAFAWAHPDGAPTHSLVGDEPLTLAPTPDGAPIATVLAEAGRRFLVTETSDGRAHVVRALDHGMLDGWVDASRLAPLAPGDVWEDIARGQAGPRMTMPRARPLDTGLVYEGPATLRAGGHLLGRDGAPWAEASTDVAVRIALTADTSAPALVYDVEGVSAQGSDELLSGVTALRADLILPESTR